MPTYSLNPEAEDRVQRNFGIPLRFRVDIARTAVLATVVATAMSILFLQNSFLPFALILTNGFFLCSLLVHQNLCAQLKAANENIIVSEFDQQLRKTFCIDPTTECPNGDALQDTLQTVNDAVLIIVQIDDLDIYRMHFGRELSQTILRTTIDTIKRVVGIDTVYHKSPHELAFIVGVDCLRKKFPSIRDLLEQTHDELTRTGAPYPDGYLFATITLGVATTYVSRNEDLLMDAHLTLREARSRKKPFVGIPELLRLKRDHEQHFANFRHAIQTIDEGRLKLFYQPIRNNATTKIEKYECLLRVMNQNGKMEAPQRLLDASKRLKLYPSITRFVIREAFRNFQNHRDCLFAINLSYTDISHPGTVDFLIENIERFDVGHQLTVELLETDDIEDGAVIRKFIHRLKSYGAKFSLDDFGTGYSNFGHLLSFPIDYLKLDSVLIKDIDTNHNSQMFVRSVVEFTRRIGVKTIAEFVHSKSILDKVEELRIDYSQGFYVGMPAPMSGP